MTTELDPYKVLGVDHAAEPEVIAGAYRALARRHHPDVSRHEDAERRMADINAAWAVLRDPGRRAAYDLEHGVTDGIGRAGAGNPLGALREAPGATTPPHRAGARFAPRAGHDRGTAGGSVAWRRGPNGEGAAGPPPGRPHGTVLAFGRHIGWSLGEVARVDPGYLQWLAARPEGAPYRAEIEKVLAPLLRDADVRSAFGQAAPQPARRRRFGR